MVGVCHHLPSTFCGICAPPWMYFHPEEGVIIVSSQTSLCEHCFCKFTEDSHKVCCNCGIRKLVEKYPFTSNVELKGSD